MWVGTYVARDIRKAPPAYRQCGCAGNMAWIARGWRRRVTPTAASPPGKCSCSLPTPTIKQVVSWIKMLACIGVYVLYLAKYGHYSSSMLSQGGRERVPRQNDSSNSYISYGSQTSNDGYTQLVLIKTQYWPPALTVSILYFKSFLSKLLNPWKITI